MLLDSTAVRQVQEIEIDPFEQSKLGNIEESKLLSEFPFLDTDGASLGFDSGYNNFMEQPPAGNYITINPPFLVPGGCYGYYKKPNLKRILLRNNPIMIGI